MKKTITIIFFVLISILSNAQNKNFHVKIVQDGKEIKKICGSYRLKKKTFDLVFVFDNPMGLLINASFNKTTYKQAKKGEAKNKLQGFQETGMAEGLQNTEKTVFISESAPNYWFYDNEDKNRFNIIEKKKGKIICTRTIENLWNINKKEQIDLNDNKKKLYFVFISYVYENGEEREIKRESIKIKWK